MMFGGLSVLNACSTYHEFIAKHLYFLCVTRLFLVPFSDMSKFPDSGALEGISEIMQ